MTRIGQCVICLAVFERRGGRGPIGRLCGAVACRRAYTLIRPSALARRAAEVEANAARPCGNCGKPIGKHRQKFCSHECMRVFTVDRDREAVTARYADQRCRTCRNVLGGRHEKTFCDKRCAELTASRVLRGRERLYQDRADAARWRQFVRENEESNDGRS